MKAGLYDYDGKCSPCMNEPQPFNGQKTFSVGVFQWILTKDGNDDKRGPVKVRVSGSVTNAESVWSKAREIADELNAGTYQGPKTVKVQ